LSDIFDRRDLLLAIPGWLQAIDDDVERSAFERRDNRLPISGHELRPSVHCCGQGVNQFFFIADVLTRIRRISVDVWRPAAGIGAPTQRLLREHRGGLQDHEEREE